MSQLSPPSNLLLACLAALGLVPALGLPWYAGQHTPGPDDPTGIEAIAAGVARWFSSSGATTTGTEALTTIETILLGVAAATVVLAAAMLITPLRPLVREILPVVPLAAPAIVLLAILDPPGPNSAVEMRWGSLVALALAGVMASASIKGAEMRDPKPAPRRFEGTASF